MSSITTPAGPAGTGRQGTNLSLWNRASSHAAATERATTEIDGIEEAMQDMALLATAEFGPIGIGWGYEIEEEPVREGAPILVSGQPVGREMLHAVRLAFWYVTAEHPDRRVEFNARGHAMFVAATPEGPFTDACAPARAELQALSACLRRLGFQSGFSAGRTVPSAPSSVSAPPTQATVAPGAMSAPGTLDDVPAEERSILDSKIKGIALVNDPTKIRMAMEMVSTILEHPVAIAEFQVKAKQRIEEIQRTQVRHAHF